MEEEEVQEEFLAYEALAERKRKALADAYTSQGAAKKAKESHDNIDNDDEALEAMIFSFVGGRRRRRSRRRKRRGRPGGSRSKLNPEIRRMLGDATLHYAHARYQEAISVLMEVIKLAPELPDSYHTLGLVYNELGDTEKTMTSYKLAALLNPKYSSLWKPLFTWSIEKGNTAAFKSCLLQAVKADPSDVTLKFHLASLYVELGNYQRAADSYRQIVQLCPENVEALHTAAKLYLKCGQIESSVGILEDYFKSHPSEADFRAVDLLAYVFMQTNAYDKALKHIEHAHLVYFSGEELPLTLKIRAGICQIHLGDMEKAEIVLAAIQQESVFEHAELITELADLLKSREHVNFALKYYHMLEENSEVHNDGGLHMKIAQCYLSLKERETATVFFYKVLHANENNIDARLTLASVLYEDGKDEEAISLLIPPESLDNSDKPDAWWLNKRVKMKLCNIYNEKGMFEEFVDTLLPVVHESIHHPQEVVRDEEYFHLIIDLCKKLVALHKYWETLEIINLTRKLGYNKVPNVKEELESIGAQVSCNTTNPELSYDSVKFMVMLYPHRLSSWNCFYRLISRLKKSFSKHGKFLRHMRAKYRDCVSPTIISGHRFTINSYHQDAAREYLEAYKLLPENPLINLCAGTALINLALGLRLQNKHQCVAQGLAFLYNNLRLSGNSQEALYNIARAFHHVGLVTLAATYYEKVLATFQKDCLIPRPVMRTQTIWKIRNQTRCIKCDILVPVAVKHAIWVPFPEDDDEDEDDYNRTDEEKALLVTWRKDKPAVHFSRKCNCGNVKWVLMGLGYGEPLRNPGLDNLLVGDSNFSVAPMMVFFIKGAMPQDYILGGGWQVESGGITYRGIDLSDESAKNPNYVDDGDGDEEEEVEKEKDKGIRWLIMQVSCYFIRLKDD